MPRRGSAWQRNGQPAKAPDFFEATSSLDQQLMLICAGVASTYKDITGSSGLPKVWQDHLGLMTGSALQELRNLLLVRCLGALHCCS